MSPAGGNLADLVVNFVLQGQQAMQAAFDRIHQQLDQISKSANDMGEKMQKAVNTVNIALGAGVALITSYVHQGLALGTTGQLLGIAFERLSLTLSGLFRPELMKIVDLIQRLTTWIQNLSKEQKDNLAHWIQAAMVATGLAVILPRIIAAVRTLIVSVIALGEAIAAAEISTGIGAVLPILGLIIEAMAALLVGTNAGREALSGMFGVIKELGSALAKVWKESGLAAFAEDVGEAFGIILKAVGTMASEFAKLSSELMRVAGVKDLFKVLGQGAILFAENVAAILGRLTEMVRRIAEMEGVQRLFRLLVDTAIMLTRVIVEVSDAVMSMTMAWLDAIPAVELFVSATIGGLNQIIDKLAELKIAMAAAMGGLNLWLEKHNKEERQRADRKKKEEGERGMDLERAHHFEGVADTYRRIAAASVGVGGGARRPPAEDIRDMLQHQLPEIVNNTAAGARPPERR
jgi:hypothetical protein